MSIFDRFRLDGKRVLITGGSRGLGKAMAAALAEAGADLVLVGRDTASLEEARRELAAFGHRVDLLPGDIGVPAEAEKVCRQALDQHGPIHVLINNVGGRRLNVPTEKMALDDWQKMIDLNLTSAFVCCKVIGGDMIQRRAGRIINIASICSFIVGQNIGGRHYETAKGALAQLTRCLAGDWAPFNVTVNAIAPGGFMTDANRRWFREMPELKQTFESKIPLGRLGEPDELGPLALYLASDASSYMTGEVVVIDGGYMVW